MFIRRAADREADDVSGASLGADADTEADDVVGVGSPALPMLFRADLRGARTSPVGTWMDKLGAVFFLLELLLASDC